MTEKQSANDPNTSTSHVLDVAQFVADGYLQEVNRRFFHPLGLALRLWGRKTDDHGHGAIEPGPSGWFDIEETDDPGGYAFGGETALTASDVQRGQEIDKRRQRLATYRRAHYGYIVQPLVAKQED